MSELSSYHLGALSSTAKFGTTGGEAWNSDTVKPLLQQGLVEQAGVNPYGQARYKNTARGNEVARNVVLHQGQFQLNQ